MNIKITEIEHCDERLIKAFERLTPQLSKDAPIPTAERLQSIISSPTAHLLAATTNDGTIVGVLTLVFFNIPTYYKAWIEDVITDALPLNSQPGFEGGAGGSLGSNPFGRITLNDIESDEEA